MRVERKRMGDMLLAEGAVTQEQIEEALSAARRDGKKMGEKLVELGYVTEDTIAQVLSNQLHIERVHLAEAYIDESFVKLIQGDVLRRLEQGSPSGNRTLSKEKLRRDCLCKR